MRLLLISSLLVAGLAVGSSGTSLDDDLGKLFKKDKAKDDYDDDDYYDDDYYPSAREYHITSASR